MIVHAARSGAILAGVVTAQGADCGLAGSVALMPLPEAVDAFAELAPPDFANEACARIAVRTDKYRPVLQAGEIRCPVLLQICEDDPVTPPKVVEDAAAAGSSRRDCALSHRSLRHLPGRVFRAGCGGSASIFVEN
ncbi:MAG: hypothetical protein R2856_31015 [Caldilineaceae bacterium]